MKHDEDGVVRVYSGPLVLVEVYKAALEDAGIACRVVGTELAAGFGSALPAATELWVHERDRARAEELLAREAQKDAKSA